jgi:hypothetical protein
MRLTVVGRMFRALAEQDRGLRDERYQQRLEYQDLWCSECGERQTHRLEYGRRWEKRMCLGCRTVRRYVTG